jgi:hypothetical protein
VQEADQEGEGDGGHRSRREDVDHVLRRVVRNTGDVAEQAQPEQHADGPAFRIDVAVLVEVTDDTDHRRVLAVLTYLRA